MGRLDGKVAVVTGGSSGIGLATAQRFAEEGARVFITGRRQTELDAAAAAIGKAATAVQGDVTVLEDIRRLYQTVVEEAGRVNILVANAGMGEFFPLGSITEDDYERGFGLNVKGVLFAVQEALPFMPDGSSVILVGSMAGSKAVPGMGIYGAAKAAIRSFARTWTVELKERGIRVNVLSPGPIWTPPLQAAPAELQEQFRSGVPLGRIGEAEEVANAALFLASGESSYVAGVELFVDGGTAQI